MKKRGARAKRIRTWESKKWGKRNNEPNESKKKKNGSGINHFHKDYVSKLHIPPKIKSEFHFAENLFIFSSQQEFNEFYNTK